jgi:hypothetical protein
MLGGVQERRGRTMNPTKYAVEFKTANGWKRWNGTHESQLEAWLAIYLRMAYADHIERRVVEVQS